MKDDMWTFSAFEIPKLKFLFVLKDTSGHGVTTPSSPSTALRDTDVPGD